MAGIKNKIKQRFSGQNRELYKLTKMREHCKYKKTLIIKIRCLISNSENKAK